MKEISKKEYNTILLNILIEFDRICKKCDLRYSLAYGTLLGAVRHKGFISWDDDIDVIMSRNDYNKLLEIAKINLTNNYKLVSIENEKKFTAPLAKIIDANTVLHQITHAAETIDLGIYIDIFVYDTIPNSDRKVKIIYFLSAFFQHCWTFCEYKAEKKESLIRKILKKIFNKPFFARLFAFALKYNAVKLSSNGDRYSCLMFGEHYNRKIYEFSKNKFDNLIDIDFEQFKFKCFKDYHYFLSKWYGNYMMLPPIEQRVGRHTYEVYFKY